MSNSAAFIKRCLDAGMPIEFALLAAEAFEAEAPLYVLPPSKEALRQRNYRANKKAKKEAERNASRRDTTQDDATRPDTTKRDDHDAPRAPVHTRGEDNPSRLDNIPNLTTLQRERDWKNRADLEWLDSQLRDAGGPAVANLAIAPGLADLSTIIGLLTGGTGPPCDLEADVLPVIRARCIGRKPGSVRAWNLFRDAIREARDRRLTGAPAVEPIHQGQRHERPDRQSAKFAAKQANMASAVQGAEILLARRGLS